MKDNTETPIFLSDGNDPEMSQASLKAQSTIKILWRELSWERRRIIPALDMACIKACFSDEEGGQVEHMWIDEVDFDGVSYRGVLLNTPNWLTSVQAGDEVCVDPKYISDWMYAIDGKVYGAYTVNLIRSRMSRQERSAHDEAWGYDFGLPNQISLFDGHSTSKPSDGFLRRFRRSAPDTNSDSEEYPEHPMSINMTESYASGVSEDPSMINNQGLHGWTFLHIEAAAGNLAQVEVLLNHDADKTIRSEHGHLAVDLARYFKWDKVVALLE
ncbi:DUF2314 domain-containing protein [Verrucomicrobiaceae bacterium N1E253]|uniref:DUF2314 domain-containing protein n=1 Tax=Oceaniferula marina TaxID=2748318 RepID=A0A851GKQ6_9BACT|nr:DUF2314 domain-containing protein [Oceaniferula marina]NWK57632.1 DUF2314 domain-containing protein [Oceaniferula marina]